MLCRPFLLQAKASYTAIGIFSLASYPYSLKLLWSPIVDSIYSLAFGRRKSWVVSHTALVPLASVQGSPGVETASKTVGVHRCTFDGAPARPSYDAYIKDQEKGVSALLSARYP